MLECGRVRADSIELHSDLYTHSGHERWLEVVREGLPVGSLLYREKAPAVLSIISSVV